MKVGSEEQTWEEFTLVTNFPEQINGNAWHVAKGRTILRGK